MNRPKTYRHRTLVQRGLAGVLVLCFACAEKGPPPTPLAPTPPETRNDGTELAALWLARHNELSERLRHEPVDLLFVGDSITHYFQPSPYWQRDGGEVWKQYYGPRNAFNLSIAGDTTVHALWRLDNSPLAGISPKMAVVNIGTNNHTIHSIAESVEGIDAVVETLRRELPDTKILLLALFPRGETADDEGRKFVAEVAQLSSKIADGDRVHFIDIGDKFLDDDGTLSPAIMPDFLHLSEQGYAIWAQAMEAKVKELMGE